MITHPEIAALIPPALLQILNWVTALVVLAESLNKLERENPFQSGICLRIRFALLLEILGWMFMALGAAGNLVAPLMNLESATLQSTAVMAGLAILIIRKRIKERPQ